MRAVVLVVTAWSLPGQTGQEGPKPEWPCVAGKAVDPAYLEVSESTGGQIFPFQKSEIGQAGLFLMADSTHPATIVRAVGTLSGAREFEFSVDSTIRSLLIIGSIQCRTAFGVFRPSGAEMTAANSAESIDLKAGRGLKVDNPEPGNWKVRMEGTGLFVLSVRAQSPVRVNRIEFLLSDSPDLTDARNAGQTSPRLGTSQRVAAHVSGQLANVAIQLLDASGKPFSKEVTAEAIDGVDYAQISPASPRFRIRITGADANGWTVERVYPVLFRAQTSATPR